MTTKIIDNGIMYWGNYVICNNTFNNDKNTFIEGNIYIWCPPSNAVYFNNQHMGYVHWVTAKKCFTIINETFKKVDELFNKLMS